MLKIAIPNKGALSEKAVALIKESGYKCKRSSRELVVRDMANEIEFFYLRPRDIALYVSAGIVDIGVTGRDLAIDSEAEHIELLPLNIGNSRFFYATPKDSGLTPDGFEGKRIATSYPTIVKKDLKERGLNAEVIKLDGAVEISIELGVADAIADVVESGRTLVEAGLATVGDPIMNSEAIIIARNNDILKNNKVSVFLKRIEGILLARQYVLVEYDAPNSIIKTVTELTPGIESPTISPLNEDGWVAVKSMVKAKGINDLIDKLHDAGAKGIFVSEIKTCRI
jgi:ATP phosphoribosyltransferase